MHVRAPDRAAAIAAIEPAVPPPTTTTSNSCECIDHLMSMRDAACLIKQPATASSEPPRTHCRLRLQLDCARGAGAQLLLRTPGRRPSAELPPGPTSFAPGT